MAFLKKLKDKKNLQKWLSYQRVQSGFMLFLGFLLIFEMIQLYRVKQDLAFVNGISESNSTVIKEISQSKEYLSNFGNDLNEIRKFLLLPSKNYDFGDGNVELSNEEGEAKEDLTVQLFTYVEKLGTYEQNQARYDANVLAFQETLKNPYWVEKGLTVDSAGTATSDALVFSFKDSSGGEVFNVSLGYDGLFTLNALDEDWALDDQEVSENVIKQVQAFVDSDLGDLQAQLKALGDGRAQLNALLSAQTVKDVLVQKGLILSTELNSPEAYYYEIKNSDSEMVATLSIEKKNAEQMLILKDPIGDYDEELDLGEGAEVVLIDALNNGVDSRSSTQKLVDEHKGEIESLFDDRAFKAVLEEMQLQMGIPSETETRVSYPLLRGDGQVIRIIFIDKSTGEVKVELPDGQQAQNLSMAIESIDLSGKKKLSTRPLS